MFLKTHGRKGRKEGRRRLPSRCAGCVLSLGLGAKHQNRDQFAGLVVLAVKSFQISEGNECVRRKPQLAGSVGIGSCSLRTGQLVLSQCLNSKKRLLPLLPGSQGAELRALSHQHAFTLDEIRIAAPDMYAQCAASEGL